MPIPEKTKTHQPLEASKWQQLSFLLSPEQLSGLFNELRPFFLCRVGQIVKKGEELVVFEEFFSAYTLFFEELLVGNTPQTNRFRSFFFSVLTKDLESLFSIPLEEENHLVKIFKPVLQLQPLQIRFSSETKTLHQNVFGASAFPFGLSFSYPNLVRTETGDVVKGRTEESFANSELYKTAWQWLRKNTAPAIFSFAGEKIPTAIKLGEGVKERVKFHPVLRDWKLEL